jgi:sialic acid synthase
VRELIINGRRIADDEKCYVIAELGSNHQGDVQTALDMVDAAALAGASAVKLQKRDTATLYSQAMLDRPYTGEQSFGATYGEHREALELGWSAFQACRRLAERRKVAMFATAFDEPSADMLDKVPVPAYKIASGGLTDTALLTHVAKKGKPIILSTGGGTLDDIDRAVATIRPINSQLALLHCTASYPAVFEEQNLRVIGTLRRRYPELVIGWSCHVHNISTAMAAYALGARIIEVHFTLNRAMKGTDHSFSLEPASLRKMVKDLNSLRLALGDGVKRWYDSEQAPISKMRRVMTPQGLRITGALHSSSTWMALSATPTIEITHMLNPNDFGSPSSTTCTVVAPES